MLSLATGAKVLFIYELAFQLGFERRAECRIYRDGKIRNECPIRDGFRQKGKLDSGCGGATTFSTTMSGISLIAESEADGGSW
jgi:hypothetical protein